MAGTNKVEFCCEHMKDGMVNVKSKKCDHHGCAKLPSYGVAGTTKREFCSAHKADRW